MQARLADPSPRRLNAALAPTLTVGARGARYEGPLLGVGAHASGLPCTVLSSRGTLTVRAGRATLRASAVHITAGVLHEVLAPEPGWLTFWYLEPGVWSPRGKGRVRAVLAADRASLATKQGSRLLGLGPRARLESRVALGLELLRADHALTTTALAPRLGLSASRLRHLVREATGVPLARLRWWLQLMDAARALKGGEDLTGAAHHAGFADSAHLSRTFRRLFGFPPSGLLRAGVQIELT